MSGKIHEEKHSRSAPSALTNDARGLELSGATTVCGSIVALKASAQNETEA